MHWRTCIIPIESLKLLLDGLPALQFEWHHYYSRGCLPSATTASSESGGPCSQQCMHMRVRFEKHLEHTLFPRTPHNELCRREREAQREAQREALQEAYRRNHGLLSPVWSGMVSFQLQATTDLCRWNAHERALELDDQLGLSNSGRAIAWPRRC